MNGSNCSILIFGVQGESPQIQKSGPVANSISEGSKFAITCSLSKGSQPINFEWLKNGGQLQKRSDHYLIESFDDYSRFKIQSVMSNDSGNYTCKASNSFGSDVYTTSLIVKRKPRY